MRQILTHALPGDSGDEQRGTVTVYGDPNKATQSVLLCGGWPDNHSLWEHLAGSLSESYLVGVICLPGYDELHEYPAYGYSFQDWTVSLKAAATLLLQQSKKDVPLSLVVHDWGCIAGTMFANQMNNEEQSSLIPRKMVMMDVLLKPHRTSKVPPLPITPSLLLQSLHALIGIVSYQLSFIIVWLVGVVVSHSLSMVAVAPLLVLVLRVFHLFPMSMQDTKYFPLRIVHPSWSYKMYTYFYTWKHALFGELKGWYLPKDLENTPILYMYGASKNYHLHDPRSLALLSASEKCKVVSFENGGHWFMRDHPDAVAKEVKDFLD